MFIKLTDTKDRPFILNFDKVVSFFSTPELVSEFTAKGIKIPEKSKTALEMEDGNFYHVQESFKQIAAMLDGD